jgi:hypothetical protein
MNETNSKEIIFFGKKINKKSIGNRILCKILNEPIEDENKYRFYSDGDSEHSDHSDHYSEHSDYSDYSDYSDN